jgi:hypothetical protein
MMLQCNQKNALRKGTVEWWYLCDVGRKKDQGSLKRLYLAMGGAAKEQFQPSAHV